MKAMLLGFNLHRTCLDEAAVPLPIPFRVRASVSEPGVLAKHTIHCSVSIVYEPAMKWKTLSGDTEGLTEATSTPEPRTEARTNWKTELKRTRSLCDAVDARRCSPMLGRGRSGCSLRGALDARRCSAVLWMLADARSAMLWTLADARRCSAMLWMLADARMLTDALVCRICRACRGV